MKKLIFIIAVIVIFVGCSEKRNIEDIKVGPHPEEWVKENSGGEHGAYLRDNGYNLTSCASCHGEDFTGGSSGVSCYSCHGVYPHPEGFADKNSSSFHSMFLKNNNWNIKECSSCHGSDYDEEMNGISCRTCHVQPEGPLACTTCHGEFGKDPVKKDTFLVAPPQDLNDDTSSTSAGVGAHQLHLKSLQYANPIPCNSCHIIPDSVFDENHIDGLPAEVQFSNLASDTGRVHPIWNSSTLTCENVYCHGNFVFKKSESSFSWAYTDSIIKGNNPSIIWNQVNGTQIQCGTCHDLPPKGHISSNDCSTCHGSGYDPTSGSVDLNKHINGKIDVF